MESKCRDGLFEVAFISGVSVTNILKPSLSCETLMSAADMLALKAQKELSVIRGGETWVF